MDSQPAENECLILVCKTIYLQAASSRAMHRTSCQWTDFYVSLLTWVMQTAYHAHSYYTSSNAHCLLSLACPMMMQHLHFLAAALAINLLLTPVHKLFNCAMIISSMHVHWFSTFFDSIECMKLVHNLIIACLTRLITLVLVSMYIMCLEAIRICLWSSTRSNELTFLLLTLIMMTVTISITPITPPKTPPTIRPVWSIDDNIISKSFYLLNESS